MTCVPEGPGGQDGAGQLLCSGQCLPPTYITAPGVPARPQKPQSRAWASAFQQAGLSRWGCRGGSFGPNRGGGMEGSHQSEAGEKVPHSGLLHSPPGTPTSLSSDLI